MRAQRTRLDTQAKLLKADVARGEKIRASLPTVGKNCDAFYHDAFLDASTGYSAIESDLGNIATKAGLKVGGLTLNQKEVKGPRSDVDHDYGICGWQLSRNHSVYQRPGALEVFLSFE